MYCFLPHLRPIVLLPRFLYVRGYFVFLVEWMTQIPRKIEAKCDERQCDTETHIQGELKHDFILDLLRPDFLHEVGELEEEEVQSEIPE